MKFLAKHKTYLLKSCRADITKRVASLVSFTNFWYQCFRGAIYRWVKKQSLLCGCAHGVWNEQRRYLQFCCFLFPVVSLTAFDRCERRQCLPSVVFLCIRNVFRATFSSSIGEESPGITFYRVTNFSEMSGVGIGRRHPGQVELRGSSDHFDGNRDYRHTGSELRDA